MIRDRRGEADREAPDTESDVDGRQTAGRRVRPNILPVYIS